MSQPNTLSTEEKVAIFDWLFTPLQARPDRPARIDRTIHRDQHSALMVFRTWGTEEEVINSIKTYMKESL